MADMSWKKRLSIVLSILWLFMALAISKDEHQWGMEFILVGISPLVLIWGIYWIVKGLLEQRKHRSDKEEIIQKPIKVKEADYKYNRNQNVIGTFLLISGLVIAGYFGNKYTDAASLIGYVIGSSVVWSLLAWIVVLPISKCLKGREIKSILVIGAVFFLVGAYQAEKTYHQAEGLKYATIKLAAFSQDIVSGRDISDNEIKNDKFGKYEPFVMTAVNHMKYQSKIMKKLQKYLNDADIPECFPPDVVEKNNGINLAEERLVNFVNEIKSSEDDYDAEFNIYMGNLNRLNMSSELEIGYINGLQKGAKSAHTRYRKYFVIERNIADSIMNMLSILKNSKGRFIVINGKLLFKNDDDLNNYNSTIEEIKKYSNQERVFFHGVKNDYQGYIGKLNSFDFSKHD